MDDHSFDSKLKDRVGEYEYPGFEPSSLAALHQQMAATVQPPWYTVNRNGLLTASSIALATLVIVGTQWYFNQLERQYSLALIGAQRELIESMENKLSALSQTSEALPRAGSSVNSDLESQSVTVLYTLLRRIDGLETRLHFLQSELADRNANQSGVFDVDSIRQPVTLKQGYQFLSRVIPKDIDHESARAEAKGEPQQRIGNRLSGQTIRDIEKHYMQGVGIKLGPTLELSEGFYSVGRGAINGTYGILTELSFSPSISLETGLKIVKRYYEIEGSEDLAKVQLPGVNQNVGPLQKAEIDKRIFEIPLTVKYRLPTSLKTHWIGGAGYIASIYHKQVFEYSQLFDIGNENLSINSVYDDNTLKIYPGSLFLSLGLSHELKNKRIMETSLFFQQSLGQHGLEKVQSTHIGLRGTYWFRLR